MLLFKPEHVGPILRGEKTQTRRAWIKRSHARIGGIHKAKTKMLSRGYFALIKILGVRQERLGDITEEDAKAEGGYTIETFRQKWVEINGSWDPDQLVFVVSFRVVQGGAG